MKLLTWIIVSLIIVSCAVGSTILVEDNVKFIELSNGLECVTYGFAGITCNWNAYNNNKPVPLGE